MSDPRNPGGAGDAADAADAADATDGSVGSVGDEAVKLLGALGEWARDQGATGVAGMAGQAADAVRDVDRHLATGAAECTYCPVCRAVHLVRQASPEVREHLTTAASSFLQAAAAMLAPGGPSRPQQHTGLERIDLEDDA